MLCLAGTAVSSATTQVLLAPMTPEPVLRTLPSSSSITVTFTVPEVCRLPPHTLVPGEPRCRTMPGWKIALWKLSGGGAGDAHGPWVPWRR